MDDLSSPNVSQVLQTTAFDPQTQTPTVPQTILDPRSLQKRLPPTSQPQGTRWKRTGAGFGQHLRDPPASGLTLHSHSVDVKINFFGNFWQVGTNKSRRVPDNKKTVIRCKRLSPRNVSCGSLRPGFQVDPKPTAWRSRLRPQGSYKRSLMK